MIHRCYNINDNDYSHYGAVGIKVDPSWFCFNTYYNDVQKLPNHDLKLKYPSMYQLDKDHLQLNIPKSQRIYSKETCIWLSKHDNTLIATYERDITNGRYNIPNRYSGVVYRDSGYVARFNNQSYGKYSNPIAAANAYNFIFAERNRYNPFFNIDYIPNRDIQPMSLDEIAKYSINLKPMCTNVMCKLI